MFNKTALIVSMTALMAAGTASAGTITGSPHDTRDDGTGTGWNLTGEICIVCHTPHIVDGRTTQAPLWNHDITDGTQHTMYANTTLNGVVDPDPSGPSLLCLSCHDGTVALDSFGGTTGATYIASGFRLGTDLSNDHPISITFDATTAAADGALFDPSVDETTIGSGADQKTGLIGDLMTYGGKVQCPSCHDVHNKFAVTNSRLLKRTMVGSALCLTCHDK